MASVTLPITKNWQPFFNGYLCQNNPLSNISSVQISSESGLLDTKITQNRWLVGVSVHSNTINFNFDSGFTRVPSISDAVEQFGTWTFTIAGTNYSFTAQTDFPVDTADVYSITPRDRTTYTALLTAIRANTETDFSITIDDNRPYTYREQTIRVRNEWVRNTRQERARVTVAVTRPANSAELQRIVSEKQRALQAATRAQSNAQTAVNTARGRVTSLQTQISGLERQISTAQATIKRLTDAGVTLPDISGLRATERTQQDTVASKQSEVDGLVDDVADAEKTLSDAQAELRRAPALINLKPLQDRVDVLERGLTASRAALANNPFDLAGQRALVADERALLTAEQELEAARKANSRNPRTRLQREVNTAQTNLNDLRSKLTTARSELTTAQNALAATRRRINDAVIGGTANQRELVAAQNTLNTAQSSLSTAQGELTKAQAAVMEAESALETAKSAVAVAEDELETARQNAENNTVTTFETRDVIGANVFEWRVTASDAVNLGLSYTGTPNLLLSEFRSSNNYVITLEYDINSRVIQNLVQPRYIVNGTTYDGTATDLIAITQAINDASEIRFGTVYSSLDMDILMSYGEKPTNMYYGNNRITRVFLGEQRIKSMYLGEKRLV